MPFTIKIKNLQCEVYDAATMMRKYSIHLDGPLVGGVQIMGDEVIIPQTIGRDTKLVLYDLRSGQRKATV